jgi:hypothetical protein
MKINNKIEYQNAMLELERMMNLYATWKDMPPEELQTFDTLQQACYEFYKDQRAADAYSRLSYIVKSKA